MQAEADPRHGDEPSAQDCFAVVAGPPAGPVEVPASVAARASDLRAIWVNDLGHITFEALGKDRLFIKWAPPDSNLSLAAEAERLRWVTPFAPVPEVLEYARDEQGEWIVMTPVPGECAATRRWKEDPARAVTAIGRALRAFHDTLPVKSCPFSWSAEARVADAQRRAEAGNLDSTAWHEEHQQLRAESALQRLADTPAVDRLVVCHGDPCVPNFLIGDDGTCSGLVDLGRIGVADRWADLAVATWSTTWNYGPEWQEALLGAYGVEPDLSRSEYYRLLYDVSP